MGEKLIFLQNFIQRTCGANYGLQLRRKQVNAISKTERAMGQKLMTPFFVGAQKKIGSQSSQTLWGFYSGLVVRSNLYREISLFFRKLKFVA